MANSITVSSGSQFGLVGNPTLGDAPTNLSVSFWIKSTDTTTSHAFFAKDFPGDNKGYGLQIQSTSILTFGINNFAYSVQFTATGWNDGNWHNLVLTFDSAAGSTLYLDGISCSASITGSPSVPNTTTAPFGISNNSSFATVGQYYDIRVYSSTLSGTDAVILAGGGDPSTVNLQAEWPITESSGTTFADFTGNGNTLTFNLTPTPFSTSDVPPPFQTNSAKQNASMFLTF